MKQLTIEHLAPYLPYGLKVFHTTFIEYLKTIERVDELESLSIECATFRYGMDFYFEDPSDNECEIKPILRPLSDLTKEIEHNGERFVPIEYFEIGDDDNYTYEFDSGNVKLIKTLETISKHNVHFDIKFLPFEVVKTLISWHFDTQNLIQEGHAIDINTLEK